MLKPFLVGQSVSVVQYYPGRGDVKLRSSTVAKVDKRKVTLADGSSFDASTGYSWGARLER